MGPATAADFLRQRQAAMGSRPPTAVWPDTGLGGTGLRIFRAPVSSSLVHLQYSTYFSTVNSRVLKFTKWSQLFFNYVLLLYFLYHFVFSAFILYLLTIFCLQTARGREAACRPFSVSTAFEHRYGFSPLSPSIIPLQEAEKCSVQKTSKELKFGQKCDTVILKTCTPAEYP